MCQSQEMEEEYGDCCFCGDVCNICSQSCGRCEQSLSDFGWNLLSAYLYHVYMHDVEAETPGEVFRNDYTGHIYYTGVGSTPTTEYMSEGRFRRMIWLHRDEFNEPCPYNPRECSLRLLALWTGAELYP